MPKNKRLWFVFSLLIALLGVTGCNSSPAEPVAGTVIHKDFDKAEKVCKKKPGKTFRTCKTSPADWDITVQDEFGEEHEIDISQSQYNRINVGDRFTEGQK